MHKPERMKKREKCREKDRLREIKHCREGERNAEE